MVILKNALAALDSYRAMVILEYIPATGTFLKNLSVSLSRNS